jgi:hypothetical protein
MLHPKNGKRKEAKRHAKRISFRFVPHRNEHIFDAKPAHPKDPNYCIWDLSSSSHSYLLLAPFPRLVSAMVAPQRQQRRRPQPCEGCPRQGWTSQRTWPSKGQWPPGTMPARIRLTRRRLSRHTLSTRPFWKRLLLSMEVKRRLRTCTMVEPTWDEWRRNWPSFFSASNQSMDCE